MKADISTLHIANEVGPVKWDLNFFSSKPAHPHFGAVAPGFSLCPHLSNLLARPVLLHQLGVAHQTSLRSPRTMMSCSDSPCPTGRRIAYSEVRSLLTLDHVIDQASPHGLPRTAVRDGRTRRNQSHRAA